MEKIFIEVMNMENQNRNLVQKLKDNAFYIALVLGLCAVLAMIAIYTVNKSGMQVTESGIDLNAEQEDKNNEEKIITEEIVSIEDTTEKAEVTTEEAASDMLPIVEENDEVQTAEEGKQKSKEVSIPVTTNAGELDFNSEKTIEWPLKGKIIMPYSMETTVYYKTLDQYRCNPGVLIQSGNGTTVKNAYLGQVKKVTSDDTYGNMVTLYLGNNYSIVYGQLDTIYVKEGDFVKMGESIGTIGNPTDSFKEEGSHLYMQMLEKEKPIDPMLFMD